MLLVGHCTRNRIIFVAKQRLMCIVSFFIKSKSVLCVRVHLHFFFPQKKMYIYIFLGSRSCSYSGSLHQVPWRLSSSGKTQSNPPPRLNSAATACHSSRVPHRRLAAPAAPLRQVARWTGHPAAPPSNKNPQSCHRADCIITNGFKRTRRIVRRASQHSAYAPSNENTE